VIPDRAPAVPPARATAPTARLARCTVTASGRWPTPTDPSYRGCSRGPSERPARPGSVLCVRRLSR